MKCQYLSKYRQSPQVFEIGSKAASFHNEMVSAVSHQHLALLRAFLFYIEIDGFAG